ncbi:MAG: C-GCAxxG-C-C family protein [Candidatus Bathyarchaeia archaeon]
MEKEEEIVKKAVSRFLEGYLCSEAIIKTFAEAHQIKCEQIPKIATGFGAGIGRAGSLCGALTGAVMAISLKHGRKTPNETEAYEKCMAKSLQLYKEFEEKCGGVYCRDLTKCDLSTIEGRRKFKEQKVKEIKCAKYVENSMKILLNLTRE